ncbi:hypothetical protein [Enterobacter hormaechei]|nr:hypothetical protein [Enterobacter hormaechei]
MSAESFFNTSAFFSEARNNYCAVNYLLCEVLNVIFPLKFTVNALFC